MVRPVLRVEVRHGSCISYESSRRLFHTAAQFNANELPLSMVEADDKSCKLLAGDGEARLHSLHACRAHEPILQAGPKNQKGKKTKEG